MSRSGFTLIEVVAATALAAVLMLAMLSVIASLGQSQRVLDRQETADLHLSEVVDLLRWDLTNSSKLVPGANALTLEGCSFLDRQTRKAVLRPVTIHYRLQAVEARSWLVRQQSSSDDQGRVISWTELVCPDVQGFEVKPLEAQVLATTPQPVRESRDAIPSAAKCVLQLGSRGGSPPWERVIVLR